MRSFYLYLLILLAGGCCFWADNDVSVVDPWLREAPPNVPMAGYMQLQNQTDDNLQLLSAKSSMFSSIEFHRSVEKDGVYRMLRQTQLEIPANGRLELKPGDYHLMLFNPKQPLHTGDQVDITLTFSQGEPRTITFPVRKNQ